MPRSDDPGDSKIPPEAFSIMMPATDDVAARLPGPIEASDRPSKKKKKSVKAGN